MSLHLDSVTVERNGRILLDRVDIKAVPGQITSICGPNGAGKSTALAVLSGTLKPKTGIARLNMAPILTTPAKTLARHRAVLPQASTLSFPFQVHEVVAMGRAPHQGRSTLVEDSLAVEGALAATRMQAFAERNYLTLSGGERQRVQLARVLAQLWYEPDEGAARWLLLDEPTAALDLKHQLGLMRLLSELASDGWGILTVLHDLPLVKKHAHHVVLMADGRIAASGVAEGVLTTEQIASAFELEDELYELT